MAARALSLAAALVVLAAGCGRAAAPARAGLLRPDQAGYPAGTDVVVSLMSGAGGRGAPYAVRSAADGGLRLTGRVSRETGRWSSRFGHVYELDLGPLPAGRYVLELRGAPPAAFVVAPPATLYGGLASAAVSFFQAQRDGPDVIAGALGRRPSHLHDADARLYAPPRYARGRLARRPRPLGPRRDVSGGWFDAGDYLKLASPAAFSEIMMLETLRDAPRATGDPAALRAEARFGLEWLMRLWDRRTGVLVYQVGIGDGNGSSVLGDHDLWRLPQRDDRLDARRSAPTALLARRPAFAANFPGRRVPPNLAGRLAGAFGLCAQVFAAEDRPFAHRCLLAGQTLYDRAGARTPPLLSSPASYYAEPLWRSDMELGAVELYLGTRRLGGAGLPHRDPYRYLSPAGRWANAYMRDRDNGQESLSFGDVAAIAHVDLARALSAIGPRRLDRLPEVDVEADPGTLVADLRSQLALAAAAGRRDPFGLASVAGAADTVPHALGIAIEARLYDALVHGEAYAPLARAQLSWVLGRNAWGASFVVGAGSAFPRCLHDQVANLRGSLDGRGPLLAGATVDGPNTAAATARRGVPDGARRCPRGRDPYPAFDGHGAHYRDEVTSPSTSEPADDYTALALLAFAQAANG